METKIPKDVVETVILNDARIVPIATLEGLAEKATTVVIGTVTEVFDFCDDGRGARRLTITPKMTFKTSLSQPITVEESGGIVPADCLASTLDGKFGERYVPQPGKYVDFKTENQEHTEVGAEVIAFVYPRADKKRHSSHWLVTGGDGLFVKRGDSYLRLSLKGSSYHDKVVNSIPAPEAEQILGRLVP